MIGNIIPTINRSEIVIRQLRYYANVNCPRTVYICDSRNEFHTYPVRGVPYPQGQLVRLANEELT